MHRAASYSVGCKHTGGSARAFALYLFGFRESILLSGRLRAPPCPTGPICRWKRGLEPLLKIVGSTENLDIKSLSELCSHYILSVRTHRADPIRCAGLGCDHGSHQGAWRFIPLRGRPAAARKGRLHGRNAAPAGSTVRRLLTSILTLAEESLKDMPVQMHGHHAAPAGSAVW